MSTEKNTTDQGIDERKPAETPTESKPSPSTTTETSTTTVTPTEPPKL